MLQDTSCLKKLCDSCLDLINHGHGEITVRAEGIKGSGKTKLQIIYGRSYVFFINQDGYFKNEDII